MKPFCLGLLLVVLAMGCSPKKPLQLSDEEKAKISAATAIDMTKSVWKAKSATTPGESHEAAQGSAGDARTHEQELQDRQVRWPQGSNGQAGVPDSQTKVTYCYWCPNCDTRGCIRWPDNKDRPVHAACPNCGFTRMVPLDSKGRQLQVPKRSVLTGARRVSSSNRPRVTASSSC